MRTWWQRRSLRFRLAAWYSIGGVLLLSLLCAVVYGFVEQRMAQPLDRQLRSDLAQVRAGVSLGPDGRVFWHGHEPDRGAPWPWAAPWFEVWTPDGKLAARHWPLDEAHLEQVPYAPVAGWETLSVLRVAPDLRLRVLSSPWEATPETPGWMLRVMRVHKPAAESLRPLLLILCISLPLIISLLVLGGYLTTRRWLSPLEGMVHEAELIRADTPGRRLPVANPHDELGRLATVFNQTLTRLESSYATLERFAADASHELRTPLTALRSVGEVALERSRSEKDYRDVIASMLEESARLESLVGRLLELAHASGGTPSTQREACRPLALLRQCCEELGVLADDKRQNLRTGGDDPTVTTDPVLLRQILRNLLHNAIKYAPDGTRIDCEVAHTHGTCVLSVRDEGPGIPATVQERIFDRFFRVDPARQTDGFGLGLALAHAYARQLDGNLSHRAAPGGGSIFSLTLPAGADESSLD